jgi:hypothetical protein
MKNVLLCRRTFIAVLGIISTLALGLINQLDVSLAIAGMVTSICAANAYEGAAKGKANDKYVGGA